MGRVKRGGYLIEWWMGDHTPKHVHIYKEGELVVKVQVPEMIILSGKVSKKLKKILGKLLQEGKL